MMISFNVASKDARIKSVLIQADENSSRAVFNVNHPLNPHSFSCHTHSNKCGSYTKSVKRSKIVMVTSYISVSCPNHLYLSQFTPISPKELKDFLWPVDIPPPKSLCTVSDVIAHQLLITVNLSLTQSTCPQ